MVQAEKEERELSVFISNHDKEIRTNKTVKALIYGLYSQKMSERQNATLILKKYYNGQMKKYIKDY